MTTYRKALLIAIGFTFLYLLATMNASYAEDASTEQLESQFHALDYKIKEWQKLEKENPKVIIPVNFEGDITKRSLLALKLGIAKAKLAQIIAKKENAKSAIRQTLTSLSTYEKLNAQAQKLIDAKINVLKKENEMYTLWREKTGDDGEILRSTAKFKNLRPEEKKKIEKNRKEISIRYLAINTQIQELEAKAKKFKEAKAGLISLLNAANIISQVKEGKGFEASEKALATGKALAEIRYDKKKFKAVSKRMELGGGILSGAKNVYEGRYLEGALDSVNAINSFLKEADTKIEIEKKTIGLLLETGYVNEEALKAAQEDINKSIKSINEIKKNWDLSSHLDKFKKASEALEKVKKYKEYYDKITNSIAYVQKLLDGDPQLSKTTNRLVGGMAVMGKAFNYIGNSLPPGLKQTVGQFLKFYGETLQSGQAIATKLKKMFKDRDYCMNDVGGWHRTRAADVINNLNGCAVQAREFDKASLNVYKDENHTNRYFLIPDFEKPPIVLNNDQYKKLAGTASDYSAYATILQSGYALTDPDLESIWKAINTNGVSFTINDGYFKDTSYKIAELAKDVEALLHIRAAFAEELTKDNAKKMINDWNSFINDEEFVNGYCSFRIYNDDQERHRIFVIYVKNRESYTRFLEYQQLTNPDSQCKLELRVEGPSKARVGDQVGLKVMGKEQGRMKTTERVEKLLKEAKVEWYSNGKLSGKTNPLQLTLSKPGTFNIQAKIKIAIEGKEMLFSSNIHTIKVVQPLKVRIHGKSIAKLDEKVELRAVLEGAESLKGTVFQWSMGSKKLGTGPTQTFKASKPKTYKIKVEVFAKEQDKRKTMAEATHIITVVEDEKDKKKLEEDKEKKRNELSAEKERLKKKEEERLRREEEERLKLAEQKVREEEIDVFDFDKKKKKGPVKKLSIPVKLCSLGSWLLVTPEYLKAMERVKEIEARGGLVIGGEPDMLEEVALFLMSEAVGMTLTKRDPRSDMMWHVMIPATLEIEGDFKFLRTRVEEFDDYELTGFAPTPQCSVYFDPNYANNVSSVKITGYPDRIGPASYTLYIEDEDQVFRANKPEIKFEYDYPKFHSSIMYSYTGTDGEVNQYISFTYVLYYHDPGGNPKPVKSVVPDDDLAKESKVKVEASMLKLDEAGTVTFNVTATGVDGDAKPLRYKWSGVTASQGTSATLDVKDSGEFTVSCEVSDSKGKAVGQDQVVIEANLSLEVAISMTSPLRKSLYVGESASFKATLSSDGKQAKWNYFYRWQPTPEINFDKQDSTSNVATGIFPRPGNVPVWVQILLKKDGSLEQVAESEQLNVEVLGPKLSMVFSPPKPYIGQETKAIIKMAPDSTKSKDGQAAVDFRWMPLPRNAKELYVSQDTRELTFIPKNSKPIKIEALARVPHYGDSLGNIEAGITARPYAVTVKNLGPLGPKPMIWKPGVGLVEETIALAVHQNVRLRADIQPASKAKVYYNWTLNEDSHFAGGNTGQQVTLNRSQVGTCEATVTVTDKEGVELGVGSGQFSVSISQNTLDRSKNSEKAQIKLAEGKKLWQKGDLDQAVAKANEALALSPNDQEAQKLSSEYKQKRADMDKHVAAVKNFLQQSKLPQAKKELAKASKLNSEYAPLAILKNDWKKKLDVKMKDLKKAGDLKRKAAGLEKEGKLKEAADMYVQANKLAPVLRLDSKIKSLKGPAAVQENKIEETKGLVREAASLEKQGKFKEAHVKYEEAQKLAPAMDLDARIKSVRQSAENYEQARKLEQEAARLEQ